MKRFLAKAWLLLVASVVMFLVVAGLYEAIGLVGIGILLGFVVVIWITCWAFEEAAL